MNKEKEEECGGLGQGKGWTGRAAKKYTGTREHRGVTGGNRGRGRFLKRERRKGVCKVKDAALWLLVMQGGETRAQRERGGTDLR